MLASLHWSWRFTTFFPVDTVLWKKLSFKPLKCHWQFHIFREAGLPAPALQKHPLGIGLECKEVAQWTAFPFSFWPLSWGWSHPCMVLPDYTKAHQIVVATAQKFCLCTKSQSPHMRNSWNWTNRVYQALDHLCWQPQPPLCSSLHQQGFTIFVWLG